MSTQAQCHQTLDPSSPSGPVTRSTSSLGLHTVDQAVEQYYFAGLAESTKRTYQDGQKYYLSFCKDFFQFPTSEDTLCQFVALLASKGIADSINSLSSLEW